MDAALIAPFLAIMVLGIIALAVRRGWIDFDFTWPNDIDDDFDDFPPTGAAIVTTVLCMGECDL
ncbi:hypothetical protein PQQ87_08595 [Paraburkholderia nemoris]|uniref:hypothetical protein n=1 Tax=Paraburkholderia nemoris TaxID=2793076 RepID=UPI0038BA35D5